jgi:hypothetical protein
MLLYRPVGLNELRLIYEADMLAFPPRLPDQPIFYPVLNEPYAWQIAREWNTQSETRAGFVTRFAVDDNYISKFKRQVVGNRGHEELWVPAEEMAEFNERIQEISQGSNKFTNSVETLLPIVIKRSLEGSVLLLGQVGKWVKSEPVVEDSALQHGIQNHRKAPLVSLATDRLETKLFGSAIDRVVANRLGSDRLRVRVRYCHRPI